MRARGGGGGSIDRRRDSVVEEVKREERRVSSHRRTVPRGYRRHHARGSAVGSERPRRRLRGARQGGSGRRAGSAGAQGSAGRRRLRESRGRGLAKAPRMLRVRPGAGGPHLLRGLGRLVLRQQSEERRREVAVQTTRHETLQEEPHETLS